MQEKGHSYSEKAVNDMTLLNYKVLHAVLLELFKLFDVHDHPEVTY